MHSNGFMMQWHFYNRLLAAVLLMLQLRSSRFCSRQQKISLSLSGSALKVGTNLKMWPFSPLMPFCFFDVALYTDKQMRETPVEIQPPLTWLHISKRVLWRVELHSTRFIPSRPLKTLVMLRPSGCSAFLSWSEMRIFSAPCVHHFNLININLMRWEFRNSPIYDLPPCHWYLEKDFLHMYGTFSNLR